MANQQAQQSLNDGAYAQDAAKAQAEKIRKAMAASPIPKVGRVTLSGGVALAQPTDAGPMVAVQQADAALYQSKQGGRNRMTVAA